MAAASLSDPDGFIRLLRRARVLEALREEPLERWQLEERLGISRPTSHRHTGELSELGLIDREEAAFRLTAAGETVTGSLVDFKAHVTTALQLAPVLEAASARGPAVPLEAFADATVVDTDGGDPHRPVVRYLSLVRETETLRGLDTWSIAPAYLGEIQERIRTGMETELVESVSVIEDVMDSYPQLCAQVCASGNLTLRLHESIPFGLAVFDDKVGIAVRDGETGVLRAFVETDSLAAREWACAQFDAYAAESTHLENFTKKGLRDAFA